MLDRALQLRILQTLAELYPKGTYELAKLLGEPAVTEKLLIANTHYLQGHGLMQSGFRRRELVGLDEFCESQESLITHKGLDFLADDGGLSAVLGVVTVKLHDDTLKSLLAARINASDLPAPDKTRWLEAIKDLPIETTKHLVLKLVDLGLQEAPGAIAVIGKYLSL